MAMGVYPGWSVSAAIQMVAWSRFLGPAVHAGVEATAASANHRSGVRRIVDCDRRLASRTIWSTGCRNSAVLLSGLQGDRPVSSNVRTCLPNSGRQKSLICRCCHNRLTAVTIWNGIAQSVGTAQCQ